MGNIAWRQKQRHIQAKAIWIAVFSCLFILTACAEEKDIPLNKKTWSGAQLLNDDNRDFVGTEIEISSYTDAMDQSTNAKNVTWEVLTDGIVSRADTEGSWLPHTVVEFTVTDGITPEILMQNGDCVIFSKGEKAGWNCISGDKLSLTFEKYLSDVSPQQDVVIGYIQNGIFYDGDVFSDLTGTYELDIQEDGEYFLYLISATSDYLGFKTGLIELT